MAVIEMNTQARPVPSAPNMAAAVVRQVTPQQVQSPVSVEQSVQKNIMITEPEVSEQDLKAAVAQANVDMAGNSESVTFGYEKQLGLLYVQVVDNDSGEVVREIPSKGFIAHRIAMREMVGLLLDKQA